MYALNTDLAAILADGKTKNLADLAYMLAKSPTAVKGMIARGIESGHLVNEHKGNGYKIRLAQK